MIIILLSFILHLAYLFIQSFDGTKRKDVACDIYGSPSKANTTASGRSGSTRSTA